MLIKDWMTTPVITIEEDEPVLKAVELLKKYSIRRLPVLRDLKLTGIITLSDLRGLVPSKVAPLELTELMDLLLEIPVKEIMTQNPITVKPNDPVEYAAIIMLENKISGIPVVNENYMVEGIITESDIFKLFIEIGGVYKSPYSLVFEICNKEEIGEIICFFVQGGLEILSLYLWENEADKKQFLLLRPKPVKNIEETFKFIKSRFPKVKILKESFDNIPRRRGTLKEEILIL